MRPVNVCACLLASLSALMAASPLNVPPSHPSSSDVTVILDVRGSFAPAAMLEMQKEANQIIGSSGIRLDWKTRDQALSTTFNDLVVITFKGACELEPASPRFYDEMGPYAFTRTANGEIQPFGEVDCDHVSGSVWSALGGDDYARANLFVGRALGRVVAHELVHMLTRSGEHGREGVQKPALSAKQLISNSLPLSALDIDRLKQRH